MKRSAIRGHAHCSSRISFHFIRATSPETFRDGDSNPRALNRSYVRHVLFVRGASRGRFEAEQDAAPARTVRTRCVREAGVTVRANYVALPLAAARDGDEGGEIRWIRVRPSHPEARSPRPKSPRMERRKAMRFPEVTSPRTRCRKRNSYKVRLAALHAPHSFEGTNEAGLVRA